ncbi:MAG: helix-turn-helix transcriptional regulator [Bacteroidota bacterium]|nr:helix-turn-helix transcriptional regulator [Bacteroidota bacterium]
MERKLKNVVIERGLDGTFSAYIENNNLTFALLGEGSTVESTIEDFMIGRDEMKELYKELGKPFPENLEFVFKYDTASFLAYYSKVLSLAGLGRLTGVAQGQLSHYVTGRRKPSHKTVEKIEKSLHEFAAEISQLQLV